MKDVKGLKEDGDEDMTCNSRNADEERLKMYDEMYEDEVVSWGRFIWEEMEHKILEIMVGEIVLVKLYADSGNKKHEKEVMADMETKRYDA